MIFRQKLTNKSSVRCLEIEDLMQCTKIAEHLKQNDVLLLAVKEFRIRKPLEYRRLLSQLKAINREAKSEISAIGTDYLLLVPNTHNLVLDE